jgi:hypothetical protein
MVPKIIDEIAEKLPTNSAYHTQAVRLGRLCHQEGIGVGEGCNNVKSDLSLGWNLGERYFIAGQPMPIFLQRYLPYRLFQFLASPQPKDRVMATVYHLWKTPGKRLFLKAALTARDASLAQIAEHCSTTPAVILIFSRLCWNVRVRWNDFGSMTEILQRHSLQLRSNNPEVTLLRVAHRDGFQGVLRALQLNKPEQQPLKEYLRQIGQEAAPQALSGALQGLFSAKNNEALALMQTLVASENMESANKTPDDDSQRGLGGMSMSMSVNEGARRIFEPELKNMLFQQTGMPVQSGNSPAGGENEVTIGPDGFPVSLPKMTLKPGLLAP